MERSRSCGKELLSRKLWDPPEIIRLNERTVVFFKKRGCPGWGANPGPLNFIYFLIFTTLPLSHSGSPRTVVVCKSVV
jgi:hypothetical protein